MRISVLPTNDNLFFLYGGTWVELVFAKNKSLLLYIYIFFLNKFTNYY